MKTSIASHEVMRSAYFIARLFILSALIGCAFILFNPIRSYAGVVTNQRTLATYATIETAILSSDTVPGDVLLCDGLFTGPGNRGIRWSKDNITLKASPSCTIDAQSLGRIISVEGALKLTIDGITLQNANIFPAGYGGGINMPFGGSLNLINVTIKYCSAEFGGAISTSVLNPARIYAKNCIFFRNKGYYKGGVGYYGTWTATNCAFSDNKVPPGGAGGVGYYGTWEVTDCIFERNGPISYGGPSYNGGVAYGAVWYANRCKFNGNFGANQGGVADGTTLIATNCAFSYNSAQYGGVSMGGIWKATNCTFYHNSSVMYGGVAYGGSWTAKNCIFWDNLAPAVYGPVFSAITLKNVSYSDIQQNSWVAGTGNISADALFISTVSTDARFLRLNTGSPCIDVGTFEGAPKIDLALRKRPQGGGYDMGAYEYQGLYALVLSPNGGESFYVGDPITILWGADDEINGLRTSPKPINLWYSYDKGRSWTSIASSTDNTGTFPWKAPKVASTEYLVSVEAANIYSTWAHDISDSKFTVAYRQIVYVSTTTGSDELGDGTIDKPYKTIQKGLDNVAVSGKVVLMQGTYTEEAYDSTSAIMWPNKDNITLMISPGATAPVTIDAKAMRRMISFEASVDLTIEGITLRNGKVTNLDGGCILLPDFSKLILRNVIIKHCTAEGTGNGGAVYSPSSDYSVVIAINCAFIGNSAAGDGGVSYHGTWYATNCTFFGNNSPGGSVAHVYTWTGTNSIFWNNSSPVFSGFAPTITYSDVPGYPGGGNINADPRFLSANESSPNFLLLGGGSPCIDSATSGGAPSNDLAGKTRPIGFGVDMGAYEFPGPSVSVESPNGDEVLFIGEPWPVKWRTAGDASGYTVNVRLSTNEGTTWDTLIRTESAVQGLRTYPWTVPDLASTECLISVEVQGVYQGIYDTSNSKFDIMKRPDPVYVSPEGNDSDPGTQTQPKQHIQAGLDVISPEGSVKVSSGTYAEKLIWPNTKGIRLERWYPTSVPTIDAGSSGRCVSVGSAVTLTINGFTLQNGRISGNGGGILLPDSARLNLIDVILKHCTAEGAGNGGAVYSPSTSVIVTAKNCAFFGNRAVNGGVAYQGNWYASNCTFFDNNATSGSIANSGVWAVDNSIFWNTGSTLFSSVTPTITYSDVSGYSGLGNINTDPKFISVSESSPNFLLLGGGSPCLDSASPVVVPYSPDLAGNPRPRGFGNDMGAYECSETSLRVIQPNGGEVVSAEVSYPVMYNVSPDASDVHVSLSTDEGHTWIGITQEGWPHAGICIYNWTPLSSFISTECLISVDAFSNSMWNNDVSDNTFIIVASSETTKSLVTVEAPNGYEFLIGGDTYEIRWIATDTSGISPEGITIRFSSDSGMNWTLVTSEIENTGIFTWEVPIVNSTTCRISVEAEDIYGNIGSDMSDADFSISSEVGAPSIEVVYINGRRFLSGEIISSRIDSMVVRVTDSDVLDTVELEIDAILPVPLTRDAVTASGEMWSLISPFSIPPGLMDVYSHIFRFYARDITHSENTLYMTAVIMGGEVQVVDRPLNYPNPFRPLSPDPGMRNTTIHYTLSKDAAVSVIIYDITGHEVKRIYSPSRAEGGRAGINTVAWDGKSLFGKVSGNGMYVFKIISRNKVIGSGKIVILD